MFRCYLFLLTALSVQSFAAVYEIQDNSDLVGSLYLMESERGETLKSIGRDYEIGINEMKRANPSLSSYKRLKPGTEVVIPSQFILPPKKFRDGIVINMAELRLYYFPKQSKTVLTFPVAMGKTGWRTPTKTTAVKGKTKNPTWYVPNSIREHSLDTGGRILPEFIPPGPDNPLGKYAIYLKEKGILIHGTNNPSSIGKLVSSGCIRMLNSNVKELYQHVAKNTPVHIIHHDHKFGFDQNGYLFMESHPTVSIDAEKSPYNFVNIEDEIEFLESVQKAYIHADSIANTNHNRDGLPQPIGRTHDHRYPKPQFDQLQQTHHQSNSRLNDS